MAFSGLRPFSLSPQRSLLVKRMDTWYLFVRFGSLSRQCDTVVEKNRSWRCREQEDLESAPTLRWANDWNRSRKLSEPWFLLEKGWPSWWKRYTWNIREFHNTMWLKNSEIFFVSPTNTPGLRLPWEGVSSKKALWSHQPISLTLSPIRTFL